MKSKLLLLIASCAALAIAAIPVRDELRLRRLQAQVATLRERYPPPPRASEPRASEILARIDALGERLRPFGGEPYTPPWMWKREHEPLLADMLAPLDFFFDGLAEILESPEARSLLAEDAVVARRIARLGTLRGWSNLLGGRAVLASRRPGGSADCARSLALAFDLLHLKDGATANDCILRVGMEGIEIEALQEALASDSIDASLLRAALDGRLARTAAPERLEMALRSEIAFFEEASADLQAFALAGDCTRGEALAWLQGDLESLREALDLAGSKTPQGWQRGLAVAWPLAGVVQSSLVHRRRLELARTALALREHRQRYGCWPSDLRELEPGVPLADPVSGEPFAFESTGSGVRLAPAPASVRKSIVGEVWHLDG
ncbi:MAG TPA: hypothetical protein VMS76_17095 [Planctomycetota bacterium]|nr:hypothetical protein [Planctomycetota bacterium]